MRAEEQKKLLASLKAEERTILSELSSFTEKDPYIEGRFTIPFANEGQSTDENARKRQELERLHALKNTLEKRLRDVRITIKKIKNGTYGQCEHCLLPIKNTRLKAVPIARFCMDCAKIHFQEA